MVKTFFDTDEFKTEDGHTDKGLIIERVEHLLEYSEYGYRFIYADTVNQVNYLHCFESISSHISNP